MNFNKSQPASRLGLFRPPRQQTAVPRLRNRRLSSTEKYLVKFRTAFDAVDADKDDRITKDEWKCSEIRELFIENKITSSLFEEYFDKIDSDMDGFVTWAELVQFLLKDMGAKEMKSSETAMFIKCSTISPIDKNNVHRENIAFIRASYCTNEYLSVSNDSIRFWSMENMHQTRVFQKPGNFQCAIVFEPFSVLAIATITRSLLFINLEDNSFLPVELDGSPTKDSLKTMSTKQTGERLKKLTSNDSPLFNIPRCMVQSFIKDADVVFFVANDEGYVEAFKLIMPKTRLSKVYSIEYIGKKKYHNDTITHIKAMPTINCYGTSSFDGKIVFWSFNQRTGLSAPLKVFYENSMITSFDYIKSYKLLVVCISGKSPTVWTVTDVKKRAVLKGDLSPTLLVSEFVTVTGRPFILSMTKNKEFRLFDVLNYRQVRMWKDLIPERSFFSGFFAEKKNCYLTGNTQIISWSEDLGQMDEMSFHTHNFPIIGTHYSPMFNEIITIDAKRNGFLFHVETGMKDAIGIERDKSENEAVASSIGSSTRIVVINDFKNNLTAWNYNSGVLISENKLSNSKEIISVMEILTISNKEYLVRGGLGKAIYIYTGYSDIFELKYKKIGHNFDISAVAGTPSGLVSGSTGGEVIFWLLEADKMESKTITKNKSTIEKIIYYENHIIVADSDGFVYIYTLPLFDLVSCQKAHPEITAFISLSSMALYGNTLITGDTLGYLREFTIDKEFNLIPGELIRCHNEEISSILIILDGRFFVTTGKDRNVRIWKIGTNEYVGTFGQEKQWNIDDKTTWIINPPVEVDQRHMEIVQREFKSPAKENNSNPVFLPTIPSLSRTTPVSKVSSRSDFFDEIKEMKNKEKPKENRNKEEEKDDDEVFVPIRTRPFSIDDFAKALEEYTSFKVEPTVAKKEDDDKEKFDIKKISRSLIPVSNPEEIKTRIAINNKTEITTAAKLELVRKAIIKPSMRPPTSVKKFH